MNQPIRLGQGDYGFSQPFLIQNADGSIFDLTNCTAVINIQLAQGSGATTTGGSIAIDTPAAGLCHYVVQQADFAEAGTYNAEILITPGGGGQITVADILFIITKKVPTF